MAKKIIWTYSSVQDRFHIYQFWAENNKSDVYSKKLEVLFEAAARLISEFPEIGTETDFPGMRVKIVRSYKIFYVNQPDSIQIIRIWDSRQDPTQVKFK